MRYFDSAAPFCLAATESRGLERTVFKPVDAVKAAKTTVDHKPQLTKSKWKWMTNMSDTNRSWTTLLTVLLSVDAWTQTLLFSGSHLLTRSFTSRLSLLQFRFWLDCFVFSAFWPHMILQLLFWEKFCHVFLFLSVSVWRDTRFVFTSLTCVWLCLVVYYCLLYFIASKCTFKNN